MRTSSILLAFASSLFVAGCGDGPNGPQGPLKLGIISGNHQTAVAGAAQLTDPVVGKLVRTKSGSVAWNWLVTPAYAQDGTTVSGSPVAGAIVCAVSVTDGGLVPFTPCTNTASDGTAVFFFSPGTKAGEARSEIRGTVNSQPAVFDTVVATVVAGPPASTNPKSGRTPFTVPLGLVLDAHGNPVPFTLQALDPDVTVSGDSSRTITVSSPGTPGFDPDSSYTREPLYKHAIRILVNGAAWRDVDLHWSTNAPSPPYNPLVFIGGNL